MSLDNAGTKWTPKEDDRLQRELRSGSTIAEIAKAHGRTELAIGCRISRLIGRNKSETQEENEVATTTEQLFLEYARVIEMCEGTGVHPWRCVKLCGDNYWVSHPNFNQNPKDYEFALAVLEGHPVFVGDRLYFSTGAECTVTEGELLETISVLSWERPKPRTFELNGQELPSPITGCGDYFSLGGIHYYHFNTKEDRDIVFDAVVNLLNTARGK